MHRKYYICFLLIACAFTACTPRSAREAKSVVAQADSLRAEGKMYGDSTRMAEAYENLGRWKWFYPDEYAHSCYHYGRLLRDKEDPVSAMQCFIEATHLHTHDYHILGRVYSNMGEIAHLAGDFPLSYDMFERSVDMFLRSGDSIAYYYGLNDMAFELAEQGKKDSCYNILSHIINTQLQNNLLKAYCYSTCSEACIMSCQYDSTIYYSHKALSYQNNFHISYLQLAQAYSFLSIKDSATFYANKIINNTDELCAINNALYILTNDDESKDLPSVRETSADRSDVQKLIEIRQGKLSQAIQLIELDLVRESNWEWLYAIMFTLMVVGIIITIYVYRKHKKQQLLTQQIDVLQDTLLERHSQLKDHQEKRLKHIQWNCEWFVKSKEIRILLQKEDYQKVCELINTHFSMLADKLKNLGRLNEKDVCLCIFVMDGTLTEKQIADILYYSHNTIRSIKRYVAQKIGTTSANLQSFLLNKAVE